MTAADRLQIELMRAASPQQRFAVVRALSAQLLALTHRAIERAHPELSEWSGE